MEKKWFLLVGLILALVGSGCARAPSTDEMVREPMVVETVVAEREASFAPGADGGEALETATQERMIIYTVNIDLVVKDTAEALDEIKDLVEEMGGYLSGSNSWKEEGQLRARATLRLPAERLDDALDRLHGLAMDVESENRDSQDVTEDFTDLESRLRNLETTEAELLELLKTRQEATGETEAILEVHRYLTEIRGQIEQIQGRMNYLSNLSAMATIHVNLTPDALARPITVGKWQPQGTAKDAIQALIEAVKFLVDALIWILLFIAPVLIILLLPLFLILRALWRWRRKRRKPTS
jgi:hypothetical protein